MAKYPTGMRKHGNGFIFRALDNGQRVTRLLGQDEAEARRLARLFRAEILERRRKKVRVSRTVREFAEQEWLARYVKKHRREQDHSMAKVRMETYILPILGKHQLSAVRRCHLEELTESLRTRNGLRNRPLSVATQRAVLSDARCLFSYAVDLELISHSPFAGKRVFPKLEKRAPHPISDVELARITELCPEPYRSAIIFAERTGLRWSEQRDLPWQNVNLVQNPSITVDKTKDGKWRRIPLDPKAAAILRRWKKQTGKGEFVMPWRPKDATWPCRFTKKQKDRPVAWHWHQLRHTAACRWLREGLSLEIVSRLLGHSSVTTSEIYASLSEGVVRAEFDRIHAEIGPKIGPQRPIRSANLLRPN